MDIIRTLLIYFPAMIECYILYRVIVAILEPKYKIATIAMISTQFFFMIIKRVTLQYPEFAKYQAFTTLFLIICIYICIHFLTRNSLVEKLTWFILYYFGLFTMELLTLLFLGLVLKQNVKSIGELDQSGLIVVAIGKFITLLLFEWVIRIRKGKFIIGISYFRELVAVCLFNLLLLLGLVYLCYNKQIIVHHIDDIVTVTLFLVFVITMNSVALIFRIEKKSNQEIETQLKLQQIEHELELNNNIVEMTDKLSKLRHDMNNHIGVLNALVKTKKYTDLEEYIQQMYEDVELANDLVIKGNKVVAVLLNAKKALAKQKNIEFSSFVEAQEFNMQNKDICALLGNILDNAIEAAEKCRSKKYVQLMIQKTEEGNVISCENSFGIKPIVKKGRFITNKENNQLHGIGTDHIRQIVTKYNGELNFDYDDETFNLRIVIPA